MILYSDLMRKATCLLISLSLPHGSTALSSAPSLKTTYDVLVIGGGSAGLTAAKLTSDVFKKSVVIVEKERLGGDCTWTGCIPSKSLLAAAKSVYSARSFGLLGPNEKPDFRKIRESIASNIQGIYDADDSPDALAKLGVDVLAGSATLRTPWSVEVKSQGASDCTLLSAKEGVIICSGAAPRIPTDVIGLDQVDYLTYESIWALEKIPDRLTVLGGGPVGCEIAQAFSRLGAKVTIVAPGLLKSEDPAVSKVIEKVFADEGITVVKGRAISARAKGSSHLVTVQTIDGSEKQVEGDKLLVSLGRSPRSSGFGLEEMGVNVTSNGGISVDDTLQTSVQGIYAAGDCIGDRQFTHYAGFQGAIAARNILLPLTDPGVLETVPAATFTSPEVASVGLNEAQAIEKYGQEVVAVAEQQLAEVDRAVCEGATDGFFKVVYHKRKGTIFGATIVAPSAGEMISEVAVAIEAKMPFEKLAKVMHPYPAYSMALQLMAADIYYEKTMRYKVVYNLLKKLGL